MAAASSPLTLSTYIFCWYLGNYYFNIFNKAAGIASGGAQFAFTLAWLQLAIGSVFVILCWLARLRAPPRLTFVQVLALAPLGLFASVAHGSAIYSNLAGSLSFGQIVKAGEPAFAALIGHAVYRTGVSLAKLVCLLPIIGGIALASATELDYTAASVFAMVVANVASAFRGGENKRVMTGALTNAVGGASNSYGVTTLWATVFLFPVPFLSGEVARLPEFLAIWQQDGVPGSAGGVRFNALMSGLIFYLYNEISTHALKSLSGVTHSVVNTAKRAVVIVGSAIAFGEALGMMKSLGCTIAIGGVMLYAIADELPRMLGLGRAASKKGTPTTRKSKRT